MIENTQITPGDQPGGDHATQEEVVVESTARPADDTQGAEQEFWRRHGEEEGLSSEFVSPFQPSDAIPVVNASTAQAQEVGSPPAGRQPALRRFPKRSVIAVLIIVLVVGGLFLMWVSAQPASPLQRNASAVSTAASTATAPQVRPTATTRPQAPIPTTTPVITTTGGTGQMPSDQMLGQLGWTAAGLTAADAFQAGRTAVTFTEREETLVFDEAGTRTGAVFLLTPGGRARFAQNDVRVATNALWNSVQQQQLIQFALNVQPALVKFAARGQQRFAWVDVSFWRWQSRIDPNDPQRQHRTSGIELNPATHAPLVHHMIVLLLRVAPQSQGTGAPMGGTGWLVSTYALNPAGGALPDIVLPA